MKSAGGRRAWTLVELLVVLAVILIFAGGVVAAFTQILRISERSERMVEAHENARAAVEAISLFVKAARVEPSYPYQYFQGTNVPTLQGDRTDNDADGRIDEEQPDGLDDDMDWVASRDDRHAVVRTRPERRLFVGQADLGDAQVDEDTVFHRDQLELAIYPDPGVPGSRNEVTSFSIGTWEGERNVLLQRTVRIDGTGAGTADVAPLAFDVLSLNFLYWNPNQSPPYWVNAWDALTSAPPPPGIELPAAVYCAVTVYAGRIPLDQLGPNDPIETVTASTVIDIEAIIHDPRYELIVRPTL